MIMFKSENVRFSSVAKRLAFVSILTLTSVFGQAVESTVSSIIAIEDVREASLVTITGGYENGFRDGMKLIAHGTNGMAAELIVLDVNNNETQTLITELFGQAPLNLGNPVTIKTINFAVTWK